MAAVAAGLAYSTVGLEGVNLTVTQTSIPDNNATLSSLSQTAGFEYPGPSFSLGQVARGVDNSEYVFVKAAAATAIGLVCYLDTSWNATLITTANAAAISGALIATASQVAFASGDYGWMQTKGLNPGINVATSTTANAQLYTSTVAGQLTSTVGANVALNGVILTTAQGAGGAGNAPGVLSYPEVLLTT